MKIKLVKAMGVLMTAGMLASIVNPATAGAVNQTSSDGIDIETSVEAAEDELEALENLEESVDSVDSEEEKEDDAGTQDSVSAAEDLESPEPEETVEPGTTATPGTDESEKPDTSASPEPGAAVTAGPNTSASPRPGESEEPDTTASPKPGETMKPDASTSPVPSVSPGPSESPLPGTTALPSTSPQPGESPMPSPSVSPGPIEEYYYEPVTETMVKGPRVLSDGRKVFYDLETGKLVKGEYEINGVIYQFDEEDGSLIEEEEEPAATSFWLVIDDASYWYQNWERQGWHPEDPEYLGEEIYDPEADAWYWLDGLNQGRMAVDMDVYIEAEADAEGNIGKWVRYDENGHMVRGWSKDEMYYFDPVYGTMAKGIVTIDGEAYEFDEITGRRILVQGFDAYGIQCNAEAGVEYDYVTCSYADEFTPVHGKAVFDYSTFESDDTHEAKEGYEWKRVVVSLTFDGEMVEAMGCRANLLYDLDYYTFSNMPLSKAASSGVTEKERTVRIGEEEYQITTRYKVLERAYGGDADVHIVFSYECHVPVGYDGMAVALCNAANQDRGERELDRMDGDTLIFRMK